MDKGDGRSGASMTNAAHTPGLFREALRRKARRFANTEHTTRGTSGPIDRRSLACPRWNRCSVRIVRARTRSGAPTPERGNRAGPKPGRHQMAASAGEHAQGWCHGSFIQDFRGSVQFRRPLTPERVPGRALGPSRTGRHVCRRVSRAGRAGTPDASRARRCRAASAPLSRAWLFIPSEHRRSRGDRPWPSGHRSRPARLPGAGRASLAHDRARPAGLARRESLFDRPRNRTGGFTP